MDIFIIVLINWHPLKFGSISSISICTIIPYVCPGPNGGGEGGGGDGGGGDGGGGVGGGGIGGGGGDIGGNGGGKIRGPQSVQSCPKSQA